MSSMPFAVLPRHVQSRSSQLQSLSNVSRAQSRTVPTFRSADICAANLLKWTVAEAHATGLPAKQIEMIEQTLEEARAGHAPGKRLTPSRAWPITVSSHCPKSTCSLKTRSVKSINDESSDAIAIETKRSSMIEARLHAFAFAPRRPFWSPDFVVAYRGGP
jgi:hypothetical protein